MQTLSQECSCYSALKLQFFTTEIGIVNFACLFVNLTTSHPTLLLSSTVILKPDNASPLARMGLTQLTTTLVSALSDALTDLSDSTILQFAAILAQPDTEITLPVFACLLVPLVLVLMDITSTPLVSVSALVLPTIFLSLSQELALLPVLTLPLLTTTPTTTQESACFSARVPLPSMIRSNACLSVQVLTSPMLIIPPINVSLFAHRSLITTGIAMFVCFSAPLPDIMLILMADFAFLLALTLPLTFNMVILRLVNARKIAVMALGAIITLIYAR